MLRIKIVKAKKKDRINLVKLMNISDKRDGRWAKQKAKSYTKSNQEVNERRLILVARNKNNKNLVGYVGVKEYEHNKASKFINLDKFAWVTWIAVHPNYRKKGIGSKLLKSASIYARKFNKTGICLDCRRKVVRFYENNGYKVAGRYIDGGEPRFVMIKYLKNI